MTRLHVATLATVLALVAALTSALGAQQGKADVALRAAMEQETVRGDLKGAIEAYKKVVDTYRDNHPVAVQALLRMAEAYQKLGSAEAQKVYERVLREFPDQKEAVAIATARVARTAPGSATSLTAHRAVWRVSEGGQKGRDLYGKVSRDGRYISYSDWDQSGDLFVHDLVTGLNRRLTQTAINMPLPQNDDQYAEETAFSRDGHQLAYAWASKGRFHLRAVRLDGTGIPDPRVLFDDNQDVEWIWPEDWSPDGKFIAVGLQRTDGTSQIGLLSVADRSLRVLKSIAWRCYIHLAFSPDGRHLAFDLRGSDTNTRDVFLLATDGSGEVPVVVQRSNDELIGWSPDGARLLFTSDRTGTVGVWSVAIEGGRAQGPPQLLKAEIGVISPMGLTDSGAFYMATESGAGASGLKLAAFDYRTGRTVSPPIDVAQGFAESLSAPVWSHDGGFLVYKAQPVARRSGASDDALRIRDTKTGDVRELRVPLAEVNVMAVPNGQYLVAVGQDFKGDRGVYRIDITTGAVSALYVTEGGPLITPVLSRDWARTLFIMRRVDGEFAWMERDIASGSEREIVRGAQVFFSDERGKAYAQRAIPGARGGVIIEHDVVSGTEREVFRSPNLTRVVPLNARPGQFGQFGESRIFVAVLNESASNSVVWLAVSLAGSDPRELFRVTASERLTPFAVSPDLKTAYVRKDWPNDRTKRHELWRVTIDGGRPERVDTNIDLEAIAVGLGQVAKSPDGRHIAMEVGDRISKVPWEVWTLEHFLPEPIVRRP